MDFQNDAEFVHGCVAGGRYYLHINAAGDVDPCVFIHYSNCNIHEHTLLEALKSPLFMAYHRAQPFNDNMFQPCPMLENSGGSPSLSKLPVQNPLILSLRRAQSISAGRPKPMRKPGSQSRETLERAPGRNRREKGSTE